MLFHIDASNGLAIYDQIVRQVKFAVAGGVLKPGEMMPSVRELARDLAINPNTIARAYRELRDDRVIDPVRGTGLEVAAGACEQCRTERLNLIRERIRQVLIEAKQSRLETREVRALIEKELADLERDKG
jgi:GntR family transcriptional regulator